MNVINAIQEIIRMKKPKQNANHAGQDHTTMTGLKSLALNVEVVNIKL